MSVGVYVLLTHFDKKSLSVYEQLSIFCGYLFINYQYGMVMQPVNKDKANVGFHMVQHKLLKLQYPIIGRLVHKQ